MMTVMAVIDGKPVSLEASSSDDMESLLAHSEFTWFHFFLDDIAPEPFAAVWPAVPQMAQRALLAVETRPRCELIDDGVLVNLRAPMASGMYPSEGDPLVSLRIWARRGQLISVQFRHSSVVPDVLAMFSTGGFKDPGDLIIGFLSTAAQELDALVASIGDELDQFESDLDQTASFAERRRATQMRSQAISLRRFIVPHGQALDRLHSMPLEWIDEGERASIREAGDRFIRMGEELESVRERAAVLHDEITDLRAERIDRRSLQVSIVALIFLPLTFVTGLLGMNVQGIPYAQEPWAFLAVTGFCLALAMSVGLWFAVRRWSDH